MAERDHLKPGLIILFGSGETSPTGRKIFEHVFQSLPSSPRLALLETPAGFELNSPQVISRIGAFFSLRLSNFSPHVEIIPARKRGSPFSPDEPAIVEPLLEADLIFMGPGSPSYAIRQLRNSLAWFYMLARHRLGAALALASSATVAFSACALPVYEIYKAGEDPHWIQGLDFFKLYGLDLVFVPHWNNKEGGAELDTSRCFMGQERFAHLMDMLPEDMTIIGLDEKTALIMEPASGECRVKGLGNVTLIHTGHKHRSGDALSLTMSAKNELTDTDKVLLIIAAQHDCHIHHYQDGQYFRMSELGAFHPYLPDADLPPAIWERALQVAYNAEMHAFVEPPDEVVHQVQSRQLARQAENWALADQLRKQIEDLGWQVMDTKDGPVCRKLPMDNKYSTS